MADAYFAIICLVLSEADMFSHARAARQNIYQLNGDS